MLRSPRLPYSAWNFRGLSDYVAHFKAQTSREGPRAKSGAKFKSSQFHNCYISFNRPSRGLSIAVALFKLSILKPMVQLLNCKLKL